ncbi:YajQ family cyclic di-GMP-binding protein [Numidum massiliense]|uniref:YajQ family cyclic di-GMP-binding protein n=1 Tax=Numidum massiliense TaxID=1522315 RepID=UPI0006D52D4A|nr:YajQ family cyclic di-GMP-binding protein [Numidum massiliense]
MAKESSFDIVSKVDVSEVDNAVNIANKEIQNRYDFKNSVSTIELQDEELVVLADDDFKLEQVKDILASKLIRRGVSLKSVQYGKVEPASGGNVRQRATLLQGIDQDNAKKINKAIRDSKLKVKGQIQGDQLRVSGKSKDDLQKVIALVKEMDLPIDVQFVNMR